MNPERPSKTLADYLVIAVSPILIMVQVGSLVFFLIQVFYRGEMRESLSWVMFWFVLAIVLVARIGIEQSRGYAMMYGLALAGATWFYLAMLYPAYLLGIVLLCIVWWSANQLTWDCTLIDEDEDASGQGLLEAATQRNRPLSLENDHPQKSRTVRDKPKKQSPQSRPHSPGLWVVYFSLAALPLFGLGHVLIPAENTAERQRGFAYLAAYLAAALGLLLTTSFLGLRRHLRQRLLIMPPSIVLGWIKSGVGIAVAVMLLALLIPRPGAEYTWKTLAVQMDHYVRTASQFATPPNPPGQGQNGDQAQKSSSEGTSDSSNIAADQNNQNQTPLEGDSKSTAQAKNPQGTPKSQVPRPPPSNSGELYFQFKRLLLLAAALWLGWWIFRERHLILQALQAFWNAIIQFFRELLDLRPGVRRYKKSGIQEQQAPKLKLFAAFKNPFVSGSEKVWPPEQVIAYSFDAVQAWARQRGWELDEQHTPREICAALEERFPEHSSGLQNLAILYGYAAYGQQMPADIDWEPLRILWRGMTEANSRIH